MNKLILASVLALCTTSAMAGEGLFCEGRDGIEISVPMGAGPGLSPLSAEIKAAGKVWTTAEGVADTIQIIAAQSASVDNRLYLDFADPNYEGVVAEIRLFWTEEETDPVYGGTLRIADHGAWTISCGFG